MEIRRRYRFVKSVVRSCCVLLLLLCIAASADSQPIKHFTVKDGKMLIALGKDLPQDELKGFIEQFELKDLALDRFIRDGFTDSLKSLGWTIEVNTKVGILISKPLQAFDLINRSPDRFFFAGENPFDALFPAVSSTVKYGYNRFRNQAPFSIKDSTVRFFLRDHHDAGKVFLAGSFNNWDLEALPLVKTDSGWIADVKLRPGKFWYKFIIDGNWITDPDNRNTENDGLGNTNSVFYYTNTIFRLNGFEKAKKVILSGSFNGWDEKETQMNRTATGWELPLYLAAGTHTYRFIVDRKWTEDPANPNKLPNEFGEYNSMIALGNPHVFKLEGFQDAKKITVTGSFNGWRNDELFMQKTPSGWELPYVLGPGNYQYRFVVDGRSMTDPSNPPSVEDKKANSILVLAPNYEFRLKAYESAKKVFVAGDFNGWDSDGFLMKKEKDEWVLKLHLSPGKHLYKFVVDGNWILDPGNKLWEENEHHTGNSVIWVENKK